MARQLLFLLSFVCSILSGSYAEAGRVKRLVFIPGLHRHQNLQKIDRPFQHHLKRFGARAAVAPINRKLPPKKNEKALRLFLKEQGKDTAVIAWSGGGLQVGHTLLVDTKLRDSIPAVITLATPFQGARAAAVTLRLRKRKNSRSKSTLISRELAPYDTVRALTPLFRQEALSRNLAEWKSLVDQVRFTTVGMLEDRVVRAPEAHLPLDGLGKYARFDLEGLAHEDLVMPDFSAEEQMSRFDALLKRAGVDF